MDQFEYRAVKVSYSHNVLNRHKWQNNLQKKQNIPKFIESSRRRINTIITKTTVIVQRQKKVDNMAQRK